MYRKQRLFFKKFVVPVFFLQRSLKKAGSTGVVLASRTKQHDCHSSKTFDLACVGRTLNQGFWKNGEIEPRIFDEKCDNTALLIKNSGFYFVRDP